MSRNQQSLIENAKKMYSSLDEAMRFKETRPKPAYGRHGLDWIVRPEYSIGAQGILNASLPARIAQLGYYSDELELTQIKAF